jgi:hypothetical protein
VAITGNHYHKAELLLKGGHSMLHAATRIIACVQGIIINGCVRDTDDIQKIPIGCKALNTCPIKPGKAPTGTKGEPVTFAGITFRTGDWIYADAGKSCHLNLQTSCLCGLNACYASSSLWPVHFALIWTCHHQY